MAHGITSGIAFAILLPHGIAFAMMWHPYLATLWHCKHFILGFAATCFTCIHELGNQNPSDHQLQWCQSHCCASSSHPRTWWSQVAAMTNIPAIETDHFWRGSHQECFFLQSSKLPRFDHQIWWRQKLLLHTGCLVALHTSSWAHAYSIFKFLQHEHPLLWSFCPRRLSNLELGSQVPFHWIFFSHLSLLLITYCSTMSI